MKTCYDTSNLTVEPSLFSFTIVFFYYQEREREREGTGQSHMRNNQYHLIG